MGLNGKFVGLAAAGLLLAAPALAADPSGFYVGIGGGINYAQDSDVEIGFGGGGGFNVKDVDSKTGWAGNAFVGYNFGGPRLELELAYRNNKVKKGELPGDRERVQSGALMANFIYEFFSDGVVSPYIGAGAGAAFVKGKGQLDDSDFVFAYQGIAGVNVKVSPNVVLSADYRYFRTADPQLKENGVSADFDYVNHTGMVGLAYRFGKSPRPQEARPAAVPPPAPATAPISRSYMVFFDFDKSDLSQQAISTIKLAAANSRQGGIQRLNVTGHADRAGTEQYNMALSLRRANAVKQVLVAEGIPADSIVVIGRGESQPLVPTADGVREAQNRRVEIILQ
ncbi:MAG: OmpA family protein [Reyranellaceae bacterium]